MLLTAINVQSCDRLVTFNQAPKAAVSHDSNLTEMMLALHLQGRLILAGVAVAFIFAALGNLFSYMGDHRASHTAIFWMLGGLGLAQWGLLLFS